MVAEGEAGAWREAFDVDALIGTVMNGRFRIVERIARGGMANVYFATQTPLDRPVAVKVLHGVRTEELAAAAAGRREDLLVRFAMLLFPGAPRYATLARSIQRDVRAFFGSHTAALEEAREYLGHDVK